MSPYFLGSIVLIKDPTRALAKVVDGQQRLTTLTILLLWTHRLANLVLLSRQKNTQAQNFDFERKKQEYFQRKGVAAFALTSQVLNKAEWTPDVLENRQSDLIRRLESEWRLR